MLIIGGEIGGLCLAQGLKRAGVNATVYERDRAITDRLQGYRVHISPKGSRALHDCLPPDLFETFAATCGRPPRALRMLTERMQTLISVGGFGEPSGDAVEQHRSVSRIISSGREPQRHASCSAAATPGRRSRAGNFAVGGHRPLASTSRTC